MLRPARYFTVAVLIALAAVRAATAQTTSAYTFHVFLRGAEVGTEEVTIYDAPGGWTLRGSGKLGPPVNLSVDYWEAKYDRNWIPLELTAEQAEGANHWSVHSVFSGTNVASDITQQGQNQRRNHTVAPDSVILPNLVFGSYEALAARLAALPQPLPESGAQIGAYIAPQNAVSITVRSVSDERIQTAGRIIAAKKWSLSVGNPDGTLGMDVWTEGPRLLRVDIPSQILTVMREDIGAVSTRVLTLARPNDEQVTIGANGFGLTATISKPAQSAAALPAVVLVSASPAADRDEIVAGIPIFAQLATALADAGYVVARYDKRGTGQSGGRSETATYDEFATDARTVIGYLAKRKDVDDKRISVLGFGEGGWIALTAARDTRIAAVVLVGTPSIAGSELVLEQQKNMLAGTNSAAGAQQQAVEQQKRILDAVLTGKGWDLVAPEVRDRVDNPLYRSFLAFDPAQAIARTRQPILVVQADLDREVPAYHGEQLAQLGRSRIKARGTDLVHLPGLNHLLARAQTGTVSEYASLPERVVSPAAVLEIVSWLKKTLYVDTGSKR